MAIWQFEVGLLPAASDLLVLSERGVDLAAPGRYAIRALRPLLEAAFGRPCRDGRGIVSYGSPEGNRIDLIEGRSAQGAIWAAIDARADSDDFCRLVCSIARQLDCELFSPELELRMAPRRPALLPALMASRAWTFALEPGLSRPSAYGRLPR
ncbi:MAG: hypothetical protein ABW005_02700 [Burkholderiaceae bacterium]